MERQVNLWRTVFKVYGHNVDGYIVSDTGRSNHTAQDIHGPAPESFTGHRLHAVDVSEAVAEWMSEARALLALGIPLGSFTTVFDGNPIQQKASGVFRAVQ